MHIDIVDTCKIATNETTNKEHLMKLFSIGFKVPSIDNLKTVFPVITKGQFH